jgi:tRNA pseudouridine55 synthase
MAMIGVLLIDKPSGPTSHDIVAGIRRSSGERRIGHTGTLDPGATGLLPLVLGGATRLSSLLSGASKTYEATIRLGFATDTDDNDGKPVGPVTDVRLSAGEIDAALAACRGTFTQVPPAHSAKKVAGARAYDLARASMPVTLAPVTVTVHALDVISRADEFLSIRVTVSSGFYVRALARDLGVRLGCGAHLAALRRTASGTFTVAGGIPFDDAQRMGRDVARRLIPPAEALPDLSAVVANDTGLRRVLHGNPLSPEHLEGRAVTPASGTAPVRILAADGRLVALAHARGGALHPVVVLG